MEIVPQYEENMVSAGLTDSVKMTFSTDVAHLFALLSKNLYGNPQLAAVREIITNAWDAHIEAGRTDTPIRIRNDGDSFVIQDFGFGIAPDKFLELYGVVGGSSKRGDNRQTGGMGIGKMAPLAVMPHFSVKSHYNGIATVYHIAGPTEESGGIPTITKVVELPTVITGLEVIFPVPIVAFLSHIENVVYMGAIKAEYETKDKITLLETIEDTDFVYKRQDSWNSNVYLRYGNISYKFPTYTMKQYVPSSAKLWEFLKSFDLEIIIKLPAGVAVVTPNREDLVITDKLKEYLEVRLEEAYQDAIKTIRKAITSGTMEVRKCYFSSRYVDKLRAATVMQPQGEVRNCMSYFTCHKPSFMVSAGIRTIPQELRSAVVGKFNENIPRGFRGIHKHTVLNKVEESFKRLIYKSGITPKNIYTLYGNISFSARRNHEDSFLFNLALNRKIVIHYRSAIPVGARNEDTLYIRIPMKVSADKLKSRLECLFGKEMDIQVWEETRKKKPKEAKPKATKENKYVCASALITSCLPYYRVGDIIAAADKTVEDPKVILAIRDITHTTKRLLKFLGEEAIKEAGIVLVHNTTAASLLRRKKPPVKFLDFEDNFLTDFLKKPEVIEFFGHIPKSTIYSHFSFEVKQLYKEILDIDLKISDEDLQFLSWVCANYGYKVRHTVPDLLKDKDIPESAEFINKLITTRLITLLKEFNIYDVAIDELRKQHK